jgi:hypothetical protein
MFVTATCGVCGDVICGCFLYSPFLFPSFSLVLCLLVVSQFHFRYYFLLLFSWLSSLTLILGAIATCWQGLRWSWWAGGERRATMRAKCGPECSRKFRVYRVPKPLVYLSFSLSLSLSLRLSGELSIYPFTWLQLPLIAFITLAILPSCRRLLLLDNLHLSISPGLNCSLSPSPG